jgi:adenosylcobinamide-phosphate synthase
LLADDRFVAICELWSIIFRSIIFKSIIFMLILLLAAFLDFLVGDPWSWLHPVQVIGWCISNLSKIALKISKRPIAQFFAGLILAIVIIFSSATVAHLLIQFAKTLHPLLGIAIETVILASCFAGRSLRDAADAVLKPIERGDLDAARSDLSRYVGRDTEDLDRSEILRALLETVAENGVDGVMAPLFWAIVGLFTPLGPAVLAIAFKAASTLDSMVGYKKMPYRYLGTASAITDDILTYIPCRLMVLTLGVLSHRPIMLWQHCARDGSQDPSPNSGWSECAYAIALGVQLGGHNTYQGIPRPKPLLGIPTRSITSDVIRSALILNRRAFLSWLCFAGAIVLSKYLFKSPPM